MDIDNEVIHAEELVSDLYDNDNIVEDVVDDLNYDVFNLVARNYHSLPESENLEDMIRESVTRATQLLIKRYDLIFILIIVIVIYSVEFLSVLLKELKSVQWQYCQLK